MDNPEMARLIWKFPLEIVSEQTLMMPIWPKVLDVQLQNGVPQLWALVDPKEKEYPLEIFMYGTGQPRVLANLNHIGTVQIAGYVWHFFA